MLAITHAASDPIVLRNVPVLAISHSEEELAPLRWIFCHSKWDLYEARNCQEARARVHEMVIPVVITEREVPGGGWKKIVHDFRQLVPAPRVIVTYRFSETASVDETLSGGAYHVLVKPFRRSEVFQALGFAWRHWEQEQEKAEGFHSMAWNVL